MITWIPKELCQKNKELVDKAGKRWVVIEAYTIELDGRDIHSEWRVGGLT